MTTPQSTIPWHRLDELTDQGFHLEKVHPMTESAKQEMLLLGTHRDDHYLFFVQRTKKSLFMVDFEAYTLGDNMIFSILPGQVHSYHDAELGASGWFLAIDPGLIPDVSRTVLENPLLVLKPALLTEEEMLPMVQCLELADGLVAQPGTVYTRQAVHSLLAGFVAMFTGAIARRQCEGEEKVSRTQAIMMEFRKLLLVEYKQLKSPGEYADALHLSLSYLNEAVKETTGFSVSYWIQWQIVLEAKRLLYYGQNSVKEIAHELGYEDHTYFSRFFKKSVGKTPLEFRGLYR